MSVSRQGCVAKGCTNYKHKGERPQVMFHNFPLKDTDRLRKWVEFCENEELTKLFQTNDSILERRFICSEHFEDTKYNNPMKKIRLMNNALPTIKTKDKRRVTTITIAKNCKPKVHSIPAQLLVRNIKRDNLKPIVSQSMTTMRVLEDSTDWPYISDLMEENPKENPIKCHNTDRYIKYETEIKALKDKLKKSKKQVLNLRYRLKRVNQIGNSRKSKLNYIMNCINNVGDESFNPIMLELIEYQLVSAFLNKGRQKWSNKMKSFCAELYHKSPTAYCFLQKIMTLPSKKTVLRFVSESTSTNPNSNDEAVEQIIAGDLEISDDLFVEQRMDSEEEMSESGEAVDTITLNTISTSIDTDIDNTEAIINKSITIDPRTTQITIVHPIDDDMSSSVAVNPKPRANKIAITPIVSQPIVPPFNSGMKTYGRPKQ